MVSEFELALMAASDRLAIDEAAYRRQIDTVVSDARAMISMAGHGHGRMVAKGLDKARARILAIMVDMLNSLNYKHQVYIAEELGALGGVNVKVSYMRGEVREVRVTGRTVTMWVNTIFKRAQDKVKRLSNSGGGQAGTERIMDDLTLGILRTVMVFSSIVDLDNKVRAVEAMTQAAGMQVGINGD